MKKWSILVSILFVLMFAVFALGSSESTSTEQEKGSVASTEALANLGDYNIDIQSCRLAKDFEGKDIVIIKYVFTNVSDNNATSFSVALDTEVYQNGIGLNESYFVADSANYDSGNQTKDIKKGASLEVEVAYELNDTTTDIEVEVKQLFSFDDSSITKIFSLT